MCLVRGEIDRESLRVRIYENDPYWVNPWKRGPNTGHVDLGIRSGGDDPTPPHRAAAHAAVEDISPDPPNPN